MKLPLFTFVIPTYNSALYIENCLRSIKSQDYENVEIIVVDQESSDETVKIATKLGAKVISLPRPKFYSPPTKSRNAGARAAKGSYLYHLDSDMEVSAGLVKEAVGIFKSKAEVGALIVHEVDKVSGYWSKCKALERRCYWGNENIESARIVRKAIFKKVKGYDEQISSGEDFDIHRRYKQYCEISFCKSTVTHNLQKLYFKKLVSKKYNYGKTAKQYFRKKQETGGSIVLNELKSFISHIDLFIKSPHIGVGTLFLKVSELGAGAAGILTSRLKMLKE